MEWPSHSKDGDGNHRFSYARLPSLLGIKSVFARGKAMIAARRRATEPGGRHSTRRRWTAAEDEAIREQLARGVRVAALDIPDRSKASIGASQQTVRGGQDRSGPARQRPWPRQLAVERHGGRWQTAEHDANKAQLDTGGISRLVGDRVDASGCWWTR